MSSPAHNPVIARLGADRYDDFEWLRQMSNGSPQNYVTLIGYMAATAVENQAWTFWQVLREARSKFKPRLVI
jgi:hypothetical protein